MASTSAVPDQPVREHRPLFTREQRADLDLDLLWVSLRRPSKATRQASEVCVDSDARHAKRITEHHVRRLATDARKRHEVLELSRNLAIETVTQLLTQRHYRVRLRPKESCCADQLLELGSIGGCVRGGVRISLEHRWGNHVDPLVCALRRKDRCNQQLKWRSEVEFGMRIWIRRCQFLVNAACSSHQCGARLLGPTLGASTPHPTNRGGRRRLTVCIVSWNCCH